MLIELTQLDTKCSESNNDPWEKLAKEPTAIVMEAELIETVSMSNYKLGIIIYLFKRFVNICNTCINQ